MNEPVYRTQIVMKARATEPEHVPTKGDMDALKAALADKADAGALADYPTKVDMATALADKADAARLGGYVTEAALDEEMAYKADLVNGVVPVSQMPPGAIPANLTVAAEADLVTLEHAIPNDRAKVKETGEIWLLWKAPATDAENWENITALSSTGGGVGVESVNGRTGAVTLDLPELPGVRRALDDKAAASELATLAATIPNAKIYTGTVTGDGSAVEFAVTHSLGTKSILVQAFDDAGNAVVFGVQTPSNSAVKLTTAVAPADGSTYRVVIMGVTA